RMLYYSKICPLHAIKGVKIYSGVTGFLLLTLVERLHTDGYQTVVVLGKDS
ncbi:hypothetical protein MN116_008914, partial [Schistosoma mekongi]